MFGSEDAMQVVVHSRPELVLSGIPEINPEFCPDAPGLISLGREVRLASGPIDNLFIDVNAILTFVECKRYCDSRLKREVYPQAINYASDLKNHLIHYNGEHFHQQFADLISSAQGTSYNSLEEILADLSKDSVLAGKNTDEWRQQFLERLEFNIKAGVCRVVLLCAPAPNNAFNYRAVRNLMQLMSFSEHSSSRYDLILMDLREAWGSMTSRIIWRRYSALPQIPLIAESTRDTSVGIDNMKVREVQLSPDQKGALQDLLDALSNQGLIVVENTIGYALKSEDTKKSIYTQIEIRDQSWTIIRHQIHNSEPLYAKIEANEHLVFLDGLNVSTQCKDSSIGTGKFYQIELSPYPCVEIHYLVKAVLGLAKVA